jgi:hypothetical protein
LEDEQIEKLQQINLFVSQNSVPYSWRMQVAKQAQHHHGTEAVAIEQGGWNTVAPVLWRITKTKKHLLH